MVAVLIATMAGNEAFPLNPGIPWASAIFVRRAWYMNASGRGNEKKKEGRGDGLMRVLRDCPCEIYLKTKAWRIGLATKAWRIDLDGSR
ncbi:MAG: hypothetical protein Q6370_021270 [Candidatus Sigynarchaeota archaeon]